MSGHVDGHICSSRCGSCCHSGRVLIFRLLLPQNWGLQGFYGPPYALLQGSLDAIGADPPHENAIPIRYITSGSHMKLPVCHNGNDNVLPEAQARARLLHPQLPRVLHCNSSAHRMGCV